MERTQINVRLSTKLLELMDKKRMELQPELGKIPTRSDIMRYALEKYLKLNSSETESENQTEGQIEDCQEL